MVRKPTGERILVENRPTDPAHPTHCDKISLPIIEAPKALFKSLLQFSGKISLPLGSQVAEIVLVQNHTAVFEAQMAFQFRVGGISRGRLLVFNHLRELLAEEIGILHVALIQSKMHLKRLVGDAVQSAQIETLRFVDLLLHSAFYLLDLKILYLFGSNTFGCIA